jgi:hypothetical protein
MLFAHLSAFYGARDEFILAATDGVVDRHLTLLVVTFIIAPLTVLAWSSLVIC